MIWSKRKKPECSRGRAGQCFEQQRPQGPPEPLVRGDVETYFLSRQDRGRKFVAHQVLQDHFLARSVNFQRRGQPSGEFHDAVIEKRRPHFNGMRHADAVHFGEDVVGKEILLIEPQVRRPGRRRRRQARWSVAFSASRKRPLKQGALFLRRRKSRSNIRGRARAPCGSLRESASPCIRN